MLDPGRCPGPYTHVMIAGPPSWSRQRPHDGSRGFQPTGGIIQMRLRRGATLETGGSDPAPPHQASRRDAIPSRPLNRGLKPTATFAASLRDRERPTYGKIFQIILGNVARVSIFAFEVFWHESDKIPNFPARSCRTNGLVDFGVAFFSVSAFQLLLPSPPIRPPALPTAFTSQLDPYQFRLRA
jgi:hypothetical protein